MTNLSDALDAAARAGAKVGLDVVQEQQPFSLSDAYGVQRQRVSRWPVAPLVWKVGASNLGSSKAFSTRDPFVGPIDPAHTFVFEDGCGTLPLTSTHTFQGEVEVVIRTAKDISSPADVVGDDFIASVHLGIEMPASRLDFPVDGARLPFLVADYGASGGMVIGAALPVTSAAASGAAFRMSVDGAVVAEGGFDQLTSPPAEVVRIVAPLLIAQSGGRLPAGSYISTGGVAPCRPFGAAGQIVAEWDGVARLDITCVTPNEAPAHG